MRARTDTRNVIALAALVLVVIVTVSLFAGCTRATAPSSDGRGTRSTTLTVPGPTTSSPQPPSTTSSSVLMTTTTRGAVRPVESSGGLIILLQELVGATFRGAGLPHYNQYPFVLYPDGRAFWSRGSAGSASPLVVQARLTAEEVEQLRGWVRDAKLDTLKAEYGPPTDEVNEILLLTVRDDDTRTGVKLWLSGSEGTYPAGVARLLDRLAQFEAGAEAAYHPERVEVMVTEMSRRSDFGPLPPQLDPTMMHVAERSIERVIYVQTFTGAEALRLQDLIEKQEFFDDARRSYQVSYRTVDALPQP